MIVRPRWPTSLAGRTLLLLLTTVLVVYVGSVMTYRSLVESATESGRLAEVAGRLQTTIDELSGLPVQERAAAARALSSASFRALWSNTALVDDATAGNRELRGLREQLTDLIPELAGRGVQLRWDQQAAGGARNVLLGAAQLPDGSYVAFSAAMVPIVVPPLQGALVAAVLMFGSIFGVAVVLLYTINAPLRRLAKAADRYGKEGAPVLPERGPREIVQVERAFNAMQRRIDRLIADRTQALAAVSHDLRTPIARLRLRCGLLIDKDSQADIDGDLVEMEAMVESTLAYLRGKDETEAPRLTDLASLLTTLVDAAIDAGHAASLAGPAHCILTLRSVSARRAFANLIDNAVIHGGCARVEIHQKPDGARITIDDGGPGIPDADMERVFEPFCRLDASRNRGTGGVGLGLTIARQVFEREGGSLALSNRPEGGLRAAVVLPILAAQTPQGRHVLS